MDEGSVSSEPSTRDRDRPYGCTHCDKAFGRLTHLRRHEQSHTQGDNFHHCKTCKKSFARLDSLKRHALTHQDPQRQGGVKVPKACVHCVSAKTKCTGDQPCRRCEGKSLDCQYASQGQSNEVKNGDHAARNTAEESRLREVTISQPQATDIPTPNAINWIETPHNVSREMDLSYTLPPLHSSHGTNAFSLSGSLLQSPGASISPNVDVALYDSGTPLGSTSSGNGEGRAGRYYVDGGGGRLPHVKRRRLTIDESISPPADISHGEYQRFALPDMPVQSPSKDHIDHTTYSNIEQGYLQACRSDWFRIQFDTERPPSQDVMNHLIDQYFTYFNPLVPFLHLPTTNLAQQSHWILALALATTGAQFTSDQQFRTVAISFLEFLRRSLILLSNPEIPNNYSPSELELVQARLLCYLCMMYCGNQRLSKEARRERARLMAFCEETWVSPEFSRPIGSDPTLWHEWAFQESLRRTGYAIWLFDAMLTYQFDLSPMLALEHAVVSMPCQEVLFEATSAMEWFELSKLSSPMPSLVAASEALYLKKYINPTTGEFSRVLLIHAIFQRTWEVQKYVRQPLSHYVPFSGSSISYESGSGSKRWLPGVPLYSAWRNAACDCLDVLHWSANSVIGAASGMEHPTVLHLHLARIVLLTPITSLSQYAFHLAGVTPLATAEEERKAREQIHKWTHQDHHKARLSVIHAGVLFWHVGRYSANGFYEPAAIFLATLTLWAYAVFLRPIDKENEGHESSDTDSGRPTVINLDRPTDDELVQSFVKYGRSMRVFLTGVGDLNEPAGPVRVAERGARLLRTLTPWGYSWQYIRVLGQLAREEMTTFVRDS